MKKADNRLTKREKLILRMRDEKRSLREIGASLDPRICRERVRQLESKARRKLRLKAP